MFAGRADARVQEANLTGCANADTVVFMQKGGLNFLYPDVDRYRHINVDAKNAHEVHPGGSAMAPEHNTRFLAQCVSRLPAVNFTDRDSGRIYLRTENGNMVWADPQILAAALTNAETRAGIAAVAPQALQFSTTPATPRVLQDIIGQDRIHTLGQWGGNSISI